MISPQALIDPSARIAANVTIGPWSVIGAEVEIGAGTVIGSHVVIKGPTKIGRDNKFFQFSSIGEDAQDKKYKAETTYLEIGDRNIFREFVTINRGVEQAGGLTRLGNDNLLMAYVHVAHDCRIGSHITFANHASLAGHVEVGDYAILSGFAGVHQFCQVGAHSFIGAFSKVTKDVLPYILVDGNDARVCGLNVVGLKRREFSAELIGHMRRAYKIIYRNDLTVAQAIIELQTLLADCPVVQTFIDALQKSTRGIVR